MLNNIFWGKQQCDAEMYNGESETFHKATHWKKLFCNFFPLNTVS